MNTTEMELKNPGDVESEPLMPSKSELFQTTFYELLIQNHPYQQLQFTQGPNPEFSSPNQISEDDRSTFPAPDLHHFIASLSAVVNGVPPGCSFSSKSL